MKAVITVIGKDSVGIIAGVSSLCAENNANILDITQSVLKEYFAMIMTADIDNITVPFSEFSDKLAKWGEEKGLDIRALHEDIFNIMHRI